jgi:NADH dehydrogenase FAD-containing subunit
MGITDDRGFIRIDGNMRVDGVQRMYAVGDSVNLSGPRYGQSVKAQAAIAASNLVTELKGTRPKVIYKPELLPVFAAESLSSFELSGSTLGPTQSYVVDAV